MRAIFAAFCAGITLWIPGVVVAQEPPGVSESCERGWLASDWPTVAVDCSTVAADHESLAQRMKADAVNGPPELAIQASQLMGPSYLFAGEAWARTAVAYAKLKKHDLYQDSREKALFDFKRAKNIGAPDIAQRAVALSNLVSSNTFVADAPDSPLLAHI